MSTKVAQAGVNAGVKAGINSAVYGTSFKDGFRSALATEVSNASFEYVGDTSMWKNYLDGSLEKTLLHSVVGGASAELMGGDFASGAAAAGFNELLSPYTDIDTKKAGMSQERADAIEQAISGFIGGVAAGAVGGEDQANIGSTIAQSATQFNRQLHEKEIKFIEENSDKFAKLLYGDNPTSEQLQDAKSRLAQQGLRGTDSFWSNFFKEDQEALSFIKSTSDNTLFTATQEEKDNFMQNIGTFYKNDNLFSKLEKDSTILGIKIGTTDAVKVANLNTITEIAKGNNAQEGIKALANAAISAYQDGDKEQGNQYLDALASAYTLGGSPQIGSAIDLAKNADNPVGILTEVLGTQLIGGIIAKSVGKSVESAVAKGGSKNWVDEFGNIKWPNNNGFLGVPEKYEIPQGSIIDRYGYSGGSFASPKGTSYEARSLAPGTENKPYTAYEVIKPLETLKGTTAPYFDQVGGGIQYKFDKSIQELIDLGYLKEIK